MAPASLFQQASSSSVACCKQQCNLQTSLAGQQLSLKRMVSAKPVGDLERPTLRLRRASSRCMATLASPSTSLRTPESGASELDGRVFNFAAGPATLPTRVLKKAQEELLNFRSSGMSVMEMSHRSPEFLSIIQKAESDLRDLLKIPGTHEVLFLPGGASTQFSGIPLNLCEPEDVVDYIVTGSWSDKAFKEAQKYCKANLAWSGKADKFTRIPTKDELKLTPGAKYVHICANETIHGVEFKDYPDVGDSILVADVSSNFCSKPIDVSKFGIIYGGVQKNIGPAGLAIVIIRKDLIGKSQRETPVMLDFRTHADNKSLYNTPPCWIIYICGLVFEDLLAQGGLEEIERKNTAKAQLLYDAIDESNGFYRCPVEKPFRSLMNVPFTMPSAALEVAFLKEATALGLKELKGHRSVGGIRASIYNAMPTQGIETLVTHMKEFHSRNT